MMPSSSDLSFWAHVYPWMWPFLMAGILCFMLYEAIKLWEGVAKIFGKLGLRIHEKATRLKRVLAHAERIEEILESTNDKLECATAYLVIDADYHREENIIIAEHYPALAKVLPPRIPYTDFMRKWRAGWRPLAYADYLKDG